jgi:serine/threonine protein kinase
MISPFSIDISLCVVVSRAQGRWPVSRCPACVTHASQSCAFSALETPQAELARYRAINAKPHGIQSSGNVVNLREVLEIGEGKPPLVFYLLLEPLTRGDFYNLVLRGPEPVSSETRLALFGQAIRGVLALYEAGIVHRDVKPRNLGVLSLDPPCTVVLDLGYATTLSTDNLVKSKPETVGTLGFLAPEMEDENSVYRIPVGVCALGCVGYALFCGKCHWSDSFNP